jgi:heat shock protein HtpX
MERDTTFRRRILLTLALIVAIDAIVVAVFALFAYPWLAFISEPAAIQLGSEMAPVVQWALVFAPVLVVFLWMQLRFTRRELLADVDADVVTRETHPDLYGRFDRLCKQAGMEPPRLAVADATVPNSVAVGGVRNATIVVSEGLLEALPDDELDTVLAHELAHVKNRDATVMTLASFLPALVSDDRQIFQWNGANVFVWLVVAAVAYLLSIEYVPGDPFTLTSFVAFLTLAAITVVVCGLLLGVLTAPVVVLSRRLSETREFVADRAAAVITGDPAALVTALQKLDDQGVDRPTSDARRQYNGIDGLCFLPHGFDDRTITASTTAERSDATTDRAASTQPTDPGAINTGGDDDQFTIETRSHPPTHERIDNLRTVAEEL